MYRFLLDETIGGSIISHATSALLSDFGKSGVPNLVKKSRTVASRRPSIAFTQICVITRKWKEKVSRPVSIIVIWEHVSCI